MVGIAWGIVIVFGLEEVLSAVLMALLLAAIVPLATLAGRIAARLPGPLASLAGGVVGATEAVIRELQTAAQWTAGGLASAIQAPLQAVWTDIRAVVVATEHLYWSQNRLRTVTVPGIYKWTWAELVTIYQAAIQHADLVGAQNLAYARALALQAMARADAEFAQSLAHADQVGHQLAEYSRQLAIQNAVYALQLEVQALAYAQAAARAGEAYAGDLFREALDYARAGALGAEAYAQVLARLGEAYARSLAGQAITHADLGDVATAAAAAAATAAVAARVVSIERSPCQRFCSPLGDLGGLLQQLADAGILALILALAAEMASDPRAAAAAIDGIVSGPLGEITGGLAEAAGQGLGGLGSFTRIGGPVLASGR